MSIDLGLLVLRVTVGLLFAGHGSQKLFGWFGGKGLRADLQTTQRMGLYPAWFWAGLNLMAELGGGLLLAFGILTPLAAAAIICAMVMAIAKVHAPKGLWVTNGGYEYNLVLMAVAFLFGVAGPGAYALNPPLFAAWPQVALFEIFLILGLIAVAGGLVISERRTQVPQHPANASRG